LEVLRGSLLGTLQAPATDWSVLLNTPATQLAQVLRAWKENKRQPRPPERPGQSISRRLARRAG
jgi:hypothetical protein